MDKNYVLVSHNTREDGCFYYTGMYNGCYNFGKVTDALRFTYEEILDYLKTTPGLASYSRIAISYIADCTFEKLHAIDSKEFADWTEEDNQLWANFHSFLYVA